MSQVDTGNQLSVMCVHVCNDGTGSFTAFMPNVVGEHGGSGIWKIVEGTGHYATLRGVGTYTGEKLSGNVDDYASITSGRTGRAWSTSTLTLPRSSTSARAHASSRGRSAPMR